MFNGYRVSVWDDEKVLEMNGGDGCIIFVNVLDATWPESLRKMKKLARYSGTCSWSQLLERLRYEDHLSPGG